MQGKWDKRANQDQPRSCGGIIIWTRPWNS
jgi:hypothetical protein